MRIRGTGPVPNDFMLVSDWPGEKEDRLGVSLVGKTGDEVNRHLDGIDLPHRSDWYLTCLIKQWAGKDGDYSNVDIERDAPELLRELQRVKPTLICTLGRASARFFLGDVDMDEVSGMSWYLPTTWSGPKWWNTRNSRPIIHCCYNPAAGFRNPEIQAKVWDGFRQLGFLLAEKTTARELFHDEYPQPIYLPVPDPGWLRAALHSATDVHIDSEGVPGREWSLQFAIQGGSAYLIRATEADKLRVFFDELMRWRPTVTYHGSLHDFAMMRAFLKTAGLPIDVLYDLAFDDTQIMAYVLQLEPIGLKPNGVRHCGMHMREYLDVIGDAQHLHAVHYLTKLFDAEHAEWKQRCLDAFEEMQSTPLIDKKTGKRKRNKDGQVQYRRVTKVPKLPMTPLHKAAKRVLNGMDPFKLWHEQNDDILVAAYNKEIPE